MVVKKAYFYCFPKSFLQISQNSQTPFKIVMLFGAIPRNLREIKF